jgi:N-acetylneuraminate lyase
MTSIPKLTGLIAAAHTPMRADGSLHLAVVEKQAAHLLAHRITAVFIGGSTGEAHSLSVDERRQLARRWSEVLKGAPLKLIIHVGHNALPEAQTLAADAARLGAHAICALAPNYFKPATVADLADFCAAIASAAPEAPFYFYDIPALTGVHLPMAEFLTLARERIPSFAGLKFTNPDFASLQQCLAHGGGAFDILYGNDEILLGALAFGVRGAVGSTYNLLAPLFQRLLAAFARGDLAAARAEQLRSVDFVRVCNEFGYLRAAKAAMSFLGVDCGPVRLPLRPLTPEQTSELRVRLEKAGFADWSK